MEENSAAQPRRRRVPMLNRDVVAKTMESLLSGVKGHAELAQKRNTAHAFLINRASQAILLRKLQSFTQAVVGTMKATLKNESHSIALEPAMFGYLMREEHITIKRLKLDDGYISMEHIRVTGIEELHIGSQEGPEVMRIVRMNLATLRSITSVSEEAFERLPAMRLDYIFVHGTMDRQEEDIPLRDHKIQVFEYENRYDYYPYPASIMCRLRARQIHVRTVQLKRPYNRHYPFVRVTNPWVRRFLIRWESSIWPPNEIRKCVVRIQRAFPNLQELEFRHEKFVEWVQYSYEQTMAYWQQHIGQFADAFLQLNVPFRLVLSGRRECREIEWSTIPEAVDGWTVRNEAEDWRGHGRRVFSYHNVLSRDVVEVGGVFLPRKEMSAELAVLFE
ncbi:hypothetical protein AAVH_20995 [Aphelenchoides avenae]|nr:hypothetical protein AAVH_33056 [Aphelenchus avenae]KAH7711677.1 hypothetical protein AAVH_20995 [Aphelenchus avenae]